MGGWISYYWGNAPVFSEIKVPDKKICVQCKQTITKYFFRNYSIKDDIYWCSIKCYNEK
jgi:hypothetical protein